MDHSVDHRAVAKRPMLAGGAVLSSDLARPQWSLTRAAGTPVTVGETGCVKSEPTEQRTTVCGDATKISPAVGLRCCVSAGAAVSRLNPSKG